MRKIVIACDSYKGCLSSSDVANAAARGVAEVYPDCEVIKLSVADGGEGTVEALVDTLGGHLEWAEVSDPLGRPVKAAYGVAGDLAIIESAAACGLTLLTKEERNPLVTSTKGLGELIMAAIDKGCRKFLIGLGGSATNDGGMGMIRAEGFLEKTAQAMTQEEADTLAISCFCLTMELAVRFLGDYLEGDPYFKTLYPEHNLVRTRCQIALAKDMLARREAMKQIVRECLAQYK